MLVGLLAPIFLLAAPAVAAEPILVPDFTPGSVSEFSLGFMLQERVIETLNNNGDVVLTGDVVSPLVGPLMACADEDGCPYDALQRLPVRWGLVVRIERREGALIGVVQLFEKSGPTPVDRATLTIVPGKEQAFAEAIVAMLDAAVTDLGPTPGVETARARAMIASPPTDSRPPEIIDDAPREPREPIDPPEPEVHHPTVPKTTSMSAKLEKAGLKPRHIVGARGSFEGWDAAPLEWVYKNAPHAGRLTVEVRGGIGMGDVDRHADARVALDADFVPESDWFQEGPVAQNRPRGGLFVGYAPTTWLDLGAVFGLQYGYRSLSTGFTVDGEPGNTAESEVQAVQVWLQPLIRFYVAPMGPVKPYLFVGGDTRLFDRYKIASSPGSLRFPEPPGGIVPGPIGGGGLMIDPGPIVGFLFEGSYTKHFGVRALAAQDGVRPPDAPAPPVGRGATIAITGGVQFRL